MPSNRRGPVMEIVQSCFLEAGLKFPSTVIDRAHRVGPIYKDRKKRDCQTIIVKFTNFDCRTAFYRKRNLLKDKWLRIDLAKKNYGILKESIKLINKEQGKPTAYIFADINCRLAIADTNNGNRSFIKSFEDVQLFLGQSSA